MHRLLIELVKGAEPLQCGGDRDQGLIREFFEESRPFLGARETVTSIDDQPFGPIEQ